MAFLNTIFWTVTYLDVIFQRHTIEMRLSDLQTKAVSARLALACLEHLVGTVEEGCLRVVFAAPDTLAAASLYTAERLELLKVANRYQGPRTQQFDVAVARLRSSLEYDPFGLTSSTLGLREGCTAERCNAIGLFRDPTRLWDNLRHKTFDANVSRHAGMWRDSATASPPLPAATSAPAAAVVAPRTPEVRVPIPDKYTLPSAASIPPVSIMTDEPASRPAPQPTQAQDRAVIPTPAPIPLERQPSRSKGIPSHPRGGATANQDSPVPQTPTTVHIPEQSEPAPPVQSELDRIMNSRN